MKKKRRLKIALLVLGGTVALLVLVVFIKLSELKNNQTYFDSLEDALKNPEKAETLVIRNRKMKVLPSEIGTLIHLKILNLGNNKITILPPEIGQLKELEDLSLENNELTDLPTELLALTRLRKINFSNNHLTHFPPLNLQVIEEINLSNNAIMDIPLEIRNMKRLKFIDLAENKIAQIPDNVIFPDSLRRIDLFHNGLKTTSPSLFSLPVLRELILEKNPLDEKTSQSYDNFKKSLTSL